MFWPGWKFRFETFGCKAHAGHTVTNPPVAGDTAVTFRMTAATPVAGMSPYPVTCTLIVPDAGTGPLAPRLPRVSRIRAGVTATNPPIAVGVPATVYPATSPSNSTVP